MRAAAPSLLSGYHRSVLDGEDRLTELLATVLQHDAEAAVAVVEAVGLTVRDEAELSFEASTQLSFSFGRLDLEVIVAMPNGGVHGRVWFENKIGAGFQPDQLPRYGRALASRSGESVLVVIAPSDYAVETPSAKQIAEFGGWTWITWARLADLIAPQPFNEVVRKKLADRTALEEMRLEFVNYLRERRLAVMDPLQHLDIIAVSREARAHEVIDDLFERTVQSVHNGGRYISAWPWSDPGFNRGQAFEAAGADAWFGPHEGWFELQLQPDDYWAADRTGEPAFAAGITFQHKKGRTIREEITAKERAAWRAELSASGFSINARADDQYVRIYATKYLAELLTAGATLDQQARALATWVVESFDALLQRPPSPAWAQAAASAASD
jgi:hypothetical protein